MSTLLKLVEETPADPALAAGDLAASVLQASGDCIKLVDLSGRLQYMNPNGLCLMEIDDFETMRGAAWAGFWPAAHRPSVEAALVEARAGRTARFAAACPTAKGRPKHWDVVVSPVRDGSGAVSRIVAVSRDLTEQVEAAEQQDLLRRELAHRIKNIFTLVNGLIHLSARAEPESRGFADALCARFAALSRALDYVRPAQSLAEEALDQPHSVQGLLATLLSPYDRPGEAARIRIVGDDAPIGPSSTTGMALSIHELATNAVKYGALSGPGGTIEIACTSGEDGMLELAWRERCDAGRAVAGAERTGFGSLLLKRAVTMQLGGRIDHEWHADGLRVVLRLPVAQLAH